MAVTIQSLVDRFNAHYLRMSGESTLPWDAPWSEAEISAFEIETGHRFPEQLREYFKSSGGTESASHYLAAPWYFSPKRTVKKDWGLFKSMLEKQPAEETLSDVDTGIKNCWYDLGWIPFVTNYSGDYHCVDLNPSTGGSRGQVISFFHEYDSRKLLAHSLEEYLSIVVHGMESGELVWEDHLEAKAGECLRIFAW